MAEGGRRREAGLAGMDVASVFRRQPGKVEQLDSRRHRPLAKISCAISASR